jgi:hypothetical protein
LLFSSSGGNINKFQIQSDQEAQNILVAGELVYCKKSTFRDKCIGQLPHPKDAVRGLDELPSKCDRFVWLL